MGDSDVPLLPLNSQQSKRHVFYLVHTLAGAVLFVRILDIVVHSKTNVSACNRYRQSFLHIEVCCWIKIPSCYFSKRFSDAAAKESIVSYHCLFSLPPFVCFVKVLLSIIMNHFFSSCSYLFSWLEVECGG